MRKVNVSEPKVTLIDNLPELSDLDSMSILTVEQQNKVNSKIRQPFPTSPYSGMSNDNKENDSSSRMHARQNVVVNTSQENNNVIDQSFQNEIYTNPPIQQEHFKHFNMPICSPSCLDVAEHISKCPICSKFYNTDKTIYIIDKLL